jgi:hypothetical protein
MIIAVRQLRRGEKSFARRTKAAAMETDEFRFCLIVDVFIRLTTLHPVRISGLHANWQFRSFFAGSFLTNRHAERRQTGNPGPLPDGVCAALHALKKTWHFYHVIFDPDVYPLNLACWDGKVSTHWQEEEHPLDTAVLVAAPPATNGEPVVARADEKEKKGRGELGVAVK